MDNLPLEVLHLICGYVRDSDHEDFCSWTLVNHRFYEIAVPLIYETLDVRFSDYKSLQHIVTEIKENPRWQKFLIHARRLNIMAMPDKILQEVFYGTHIRTDYANGPDEKIRPRDLIPEIFGTPRFVFDRCLTEPLPLMLPLTLKKWRDPGFYKEKEWGPLISLIGSMKHLTEIHYLLRNTFPKCLLEVIHKHHATCQLSVWGTQFLQIPGQRLEGLIFAESPEFQDPFEMDLLRSPCLHALSIFYLVERVSKHKVVAENIFPLITMAPNLKHIHIREAIDGDQVVIAERNQFLAEFIASRIKSINVATPISLFLQDFCFDALKEWDESTDFSSLRALEFPNSFSPLDIMTQLSKFPNLEYLYLGLQSAYEPLASWSFGSELRTMFAGLKPLKYLRVSCPRDTAVIHEIFAHHGRTLREFIIEPYMPHGQEPDHFHPLYSIFNASDLIDLGKHAPHLQKLRLPLRRSLGDKTECQLYEAVGNNFPRLHSLILELDCNPRESIGRDWNQFSEQNPALPARDVFINAAMDETLAKAIWDRIDLAGGGKRLRNLRISVIGISSLRQAEGEIARRMARSFFISRSISYLGGTHMKIREIGKDLIELQTARQLELEIPPEDRYEDDDWAEPFELSKEVQDVVSSLWPSKSEEFTWDFEWKSFPLQC